MGSQEYHTKLTIVESEIETVQNALYLGQLISFTNRIKKELEMRISTACNKFWSLKNMLRGPFQEKLRSKIFNMCVVPVFNIRFPNLTTNKKKFKNPNYSKRHEKGNTKPKEERPCKN